ncbi:hypothetical protein LEN26_016636 [Aphanomyces euteiches]|nr:hypothetical protein LEN26_016636 [Aphanomyces euteiches]
MVPTLVNVNADVYRDYVIKKVVLAIQVNFPSVNKHVIHQQCNITRSDHGRRVCLSLHGRFEVCFMQSAPNTPHLDFLDLGFFASIHALQNRMVSRTIDDVVISTLATFEGLSSETLEDVFLTVLEHLGGNHFRLPHVKKETLRRAGALMTTLSSSGSFMD